MPEPLRPNLPAGATVVVVGAVGKQFFFERCHALGVRSIVVDCAPCPWLTGESNRLVHPDDVVLVPACGDTVDALAGADALRGLLGLKADNSPTKADAVPVFGVVSWWEPNLHQAAVLAEALGAGARQNTPGSVKCARSKLLTRQAMHKAGLPSPVARAVTDRASLETAIEAVSFPAVLKPQSGYNSFHTFVCDTAEDARAALLQVEKECRESTAFNVKMFESGICMVLEEYLDGYKVDVDLVVDTGTLKWSMVSRTMDSQFDPTFLPSYVSPACKSGGGRVTKEDWHALVDLAFRTVTEALGCRHGLFNCELKMTTAGVPAVIEINCRMVGTFVRHLIREAVGVDLVDQVLLLSMGLPSNAVEQEKAYQPHRHFACGVNAYGQLRSGDALAQLPAHNADVVLTLRTAGEHNIALADHTRDGLEMTHHGWVIAKGNTFAAAWRNAETATASLMAKGPAQMMAEATRREIDPRRLLAHRERERALRARTGEALAAAQAESDPAKRQAILTEHVRQEWLLSETSPETPQLALVDGLSWFNTGPDNKQLRLTDDLEGRVVLADVFSSACINCSHALAWMRKLHERYEPANRPDVALVGLHAGKHTGERDQRGLTKAIERMKVPHPVCEDSDYVLLEGLGVRCWPTFAVFSPTGRMVAHCTDDDADDSLLAGLVDATVAVAAERGVKLRTDELPMGSGGGDGAHGDGDDDGGVIVDEDGSVRGRSSVAGTGDRPNIPRSLRFPMGLCMVPARHRGKTDDGGDGGDEPELLALCDSGRSRVLLLRLNADCTCASLFGEVRLTSNSNPVGICATPDRVLYVACNDSHQVWRIDVGSLKATVVGGTGQRLRDPRLDRSSVARLARGQGAAVDEKMSSPHGLEWDEANKRLVIGMAGVHQVWTIDCSTATGGTARLVAGNGDEGQRGFVPGSSPASVPSLVQTSWAQPSGMALRAGDGVLAVADAESSTVRMLSLGDNVSSPVPFATTLCGGGLDPDDDTQLFAFGDRCGRGREARLQHPLDVKWLDAAGTTLVVADTFNHRLKTVRASDGLVEPLCGSGERGSSDGSGADAGFDEPAGLVVLHPGSDALPAAIVLVSDCNNHALRGVDPTSGRVWTVQVGRCTCASHGDDDDGGDDEEGAKDGEVRFRVQLPAGYHWTEEAPSRFKVVAVDGDGGDAKGDAPLLEGDLRAVHGRVRVPSGTGAVQLRFTALFCAEGGVCAMHRGTVEAEASKPAVVEVPAPRT